MTTMTVSKASRTNWPRLQKQKKGSSSPHSLIPRRVEFNWADTPLEWIPGQPFASHFINQINMILPAGEYWFCRLFNKALPHITDEKLREDVKAFIRQEAMHARAHGGAVEEYLQNHNIETARNTDFMDSLFKVALADNPFGQKIPKRLERNWLVFRLGLVAAIEHMTCVLGMYALENKAWDNAGADEVLLDLLRWHGAEEVEHRCVAFDLYQHLGGSYVSRSYLALITFPLIFGLWVDGAAHLMKQDSRFAKKRPSIFRPWIWREWIRTAKTGHLPGLTWLTLKELSFLSPLYNPSNEGSTELALNYLNGSPAYLATQKPEAKAIAESAT